MKRILAVCMAWVSLFVLPAAVLADGKEQHGAKDKHHDELAEPIFTKRSFPEKEIELEVAFDNKADEDELEIGIGASWVFFNRLQLGVEIPFEIRDPEEGDTESDLGDVEFSGKYMLHRAPENRFLLSFDVEIAPPTGDEDKEIGQKGEWGLFLTAGSSVPMDWLVPGGRVPDLGAHLQFGYSQQMRLTDEERGEAEELGVAAVHEKELIWNLAFNAKLFDGILIPEFEVLGRTVVDAIERKEKGTFVELAGGLWLAPFKEDSPLGGFRLGVAAKAPVTNKKERFVSTLFILKWEF
ncbi:MAG: hypothetical protein ACE5JU_18945 [Candidatus Binatia bacterium]